MKFLLATLLYFVLLLTSTSCWALLVPLVSRPPAPQAAAPPASAISKNNKVKTVPSSRRNLLEHISLAVIAATTPACLPSAAIAAAASPAERRGDIVITLPQPGSKLGLELMDVTIGGSPSSARSVAAIKRVLGSSNQQLQAGMILPDFENAAQVQQLLQNGPYPLTLTFRNLAAAGDAYADDGTPLVTASDALQMAQQSAAAPSSTKTTATGTGSAPAVVPFEITKVKEQPANDNNCPIRSRRNDVLEIVYTARYSSSPEAARNNNGVVYDSSLGVARKRSTSG